MASVIPLDIVKEEIREKIDPIIVLEHCGVTDYTGGRGEVRCPCPIHQGTKNNFSWNLNTGIWTCWSHHCGEDEGVPRDIFLLVQLVLGVNFMDAVKFLGGIAGVHIDESYNKEKMDQFKIENWLRQKRKQKRRYNTPLDEEILNMFDPTPHPYLLNRGYSKESINIFEIKYANSGEFKNRIILPIRDDESYLVGLSGRLATDDPYEMEKHGKYKNMMDFSKGGVLYGLDKAKEVIPYTDYPVKNSLVITEGQLDVVRMWDYGIYNVVASMGTSLLPEQIELIIKYTSNVVLAYDGDSPGRNAQKRVYEQLKPYCSVWFLDLPEDKDLGCLSFDEAWSVYLSPKTMLEYLPKLKN